MSDSNPNYLPNFPLSHGNLTGPAIGDILPVSHCEFLIPPRKINPSAGALTKHLQEWRGKLPRGRGRKSPMRTQLRKESGRRVTITAMLVFRKSHLTCTMLMKSRKTWPFVVQSCTVMARSDGTSSFSRLNRYS